MIRIAPPPLAEVIEAARVSALHSYGNVDADLLPEFTHLAELVAQMVQLPVVMISFMEKDRQRVKAAIGLPIAEIPRHLSFCHHTLAAPGGRLIVPDLSADVRFDYHPLVHSAPFLRFYAGMALIDGGGYRLGTVSVMDRRSSEFSAAGWDVLQQAGARVVELLAERRNNPCHTPGTPLSGHTTMGASTFASSIPPEGGLDAARPRLSGSGARQASPQGLAAPQLAMPGDPIPVGSGRAWIGVKTELAPSLPGSGEIGRCIMKVVRNSPAERAGLQVGDVLLSIDQHPTRRSNDIMAALASHTFGERAVLSLWRSGQRVQASITIEEAPPFYGEPLAVPRRGRS